MKRSTKLGTLAAASLALTSLMPVAPAGAVGDANAAVGFRGVNGADTTQPITDATYGEVSGTTGAATDGPLSFVTNGTGAPRAVLTGGVSSTITPTSVTSTALGIEMYGTPRTAGLPVMVTAAAVTARCSFDETTGTVQGTTVITGGTRFVTSMFTSGMRFDPAPNAQHFTQGGRVIMNRQTVNADGSLTVDGMVFTDMTRAEYTVASVTCQPANLLAVDAISPVVGLGAAGAVGAAGGVAWYGRSRRRPAPVARPALAG